MDLFHNNVITACPICQGSRIQYAFVDGLGRRVFECEECDFLFLNPRTQKGGEQPEGQPILDDTSRCDPFDPNWLRRIMTYHESDGRRLLAIGCSDASFGNAVQDLKLAITARPSYDPSTNLPTGFFDCCILNRILEREPDPVGLLSRVHSALVDRGTLVLNITAISSGRAGTASRRLEKVDPAQRQYFSSQTVQNALAKAGFGEIYLATEPTFSTGNLAVFSRKARINQPHKLSVILPVYNELKTFPVIIKELMKKQIEGLDKEIIIVESNSTDGTRDEVAKYRDAPGVKIVWEERPRGKGHAVRNGLPQATGDFIMIQDGDLEYDINDYDQLLQPLRQYQKAFVLGSRHSRGWKMREFTTQKPIALIMNLGHIFFTTLVNLFLGTGIKDPFTMYKVFRRDCLYNLTMHGNRFDLDWELVVKFVRKGYLPLELPVNYRSRSFQEGKKISLIKDTLVCLKTLIRCRFEPLLQRKY